MAERGAAKRARTKPASTDAAEASRPLTPVAGEGGAPALDRIIHERMRLGIVSALAANEVLSFNELKRLMDTSDGNLSVHARKLEDAGYVLCTKGFEGRVPRTEFRLTDAGRRALGAYVDHMEALLRAVRPSVDAGAARRPRR